MVHPIILFIGNLIPSKVPENYVRSLELLNANGINFSAILIGSGPLKPKLKGLIQDLGLDNKLKMLGEISFNIINEYYACADILILPSLAEGLPRVILEAESAETAIIATNIAGIPEALKHNETGILITTNDKNAIYNAIIKCLDKNRYIRMGKKGRLLVQDRFSWENNVKKYMKIY